MAGLLLKSKRSVGLVSAAWLLVGAACLGSFQPSAVAQSRSKPTSPVLSKPTPPNRTPRASVMLGIDVLEADGFAAVRGKRIGLLTHAAGVNRLGVSTVDVLRRSPRVKLVALFAVEHGIYNDQEAEQPFGDTIDPRTRLPVYSLYNTTGKKFRPTPAQLRKIDTLVIDLQDIGVRSYTFSGAMKSAMEACFEAGKEVVVLDRPNPLGGLKVDGPIIDADLMTDVGRFRVPYVHGLTIGELARMALDLQPPGGLAISAQARARARLKVVPMRGWRRQMRWPETGLTFVPTSQKIEDFAAVIGYAMVGLGCQSSGFVHGLGKNYPFRGIYFRGKSVEQLLRDLNALRLGGLKYRVVSSLNERGQPATGVFVEVADWDGWHPTELSFQLMRLACRYNPPNPFAELSGPHERTFNIHVGSSAWWEALRRDGARVDVDRFLRVWRDQAAVYQQQTRKYWLYH